MPPSTTAAEIEAALFGLHGSITDEYRQHARMLRSNLGATSNAELRDRVLSGELSPDELVKRDSQSLAPEALQEQRRKAREKALQEDVVQGLVPATSLKSMTSEDRMAYDPGMAPPVWRREASNLERDPSQDTAASQGAAASVASSVPLPAPLPMVPPPTPFRYGAEDATGMGASSDASSMAPPPPPTPEVLATPAADDEDEDAAALIRFLGGRPA